MGDSDLTGRIAAVDRRRYGSRLTTAASVGATTLYVEQTGDFDEDGGQVLVGGDLYDYTNLDEDAGTITIDPTLSVASEVDDPVDIFDPEVGTIVVEYVALVLLDDQDPGDEPIEVAINHGLFDYLSEGVRGGAAENVTLSPDGPDDYVISQVDGKEVENIAVDGAITLAGEAITAAEESLTAAQLAQAILDGEIDYYYTTSAPWAIGSTAHDDDLGDVWVDTDSDPKVAYRWGVPTAREWNVMADGGLVAALFAAQDAQTTADGKIAHFVGSTTPTAEGYGDIWTNTAEDNKKYYWDGDSWEPLPLGSDGIASEIIGKIITGGLFRTATSGQRVEISNDVSGGLIKFYFGGSTTAGILNPYLDVYSKPSVVLTSGYASGGSAAYLRLRSAASGSRIVEIGGDTTSISGDLHVSGDLTVDGTYPSSGGGSSWVGAATSNLDMNGYNVTEVGRLDMGGDIDLNGHDLLAAGDVTASGAIDGGSVTGDEVYTKTAGTTTSIPNARLTPSGRLIYTTHANSSRRFKDDITPLDLTDEQMYGWTPVSYVHTEAHRANDETPGQIHWGVIAEDLEDRGFEPLLGRDADGLASEVDYPKLATVQQAAIRDLHARCAQQAAQIADLTARLEALETR